MRSLRYCNRDKNMTSGNRTVSFRILDHTGDNWSKPVYTIIRGFSVNNPPIYRPPANYSELFTIKDKAYYNNITGNVTYRPDPAYYGLDLIYVRTCDTLNGCTVGNITVVVQNVNRPPSVLNFTHYSNEDNFDLIAGLFNYVSDGETPHDNILGTLLFSIVNTTSGAYKGLGTTSKGGALRVYNTHGITTYDLPKWLCGGGHLHLLCV